jgi:hypothetical protein
MMGVPVKRTENDSFLTDNTASTTLISDQWPVASKVTSHEAPTTSALQDSVGVERCAAYNNIVEFLARLAYVFTDDFCTVRGRLGQLNTMRII